MTTLFTIGYEGATPDDLLYALQQAQVNLLVDVRAVALSRKRGFSKTALKTFLESHGIAYRHLRDSGTPREGREASKRGNHALMREVFGAQLQTPEAQQGLIDAAQLAQEHTACLLCFEAAPAECHRTLIAEVLQQRHGFTVQPLYTKVGVAT